MDASTLARLTAFAAGWEGSNAAVSVSPADAGALESIGVRVLNGQVNAREMCAAVRKATRESQPTDTPAPPVAPPVPPPPPAPPVPPQAGAPENDGLEEWTVAELRQFAESEAIALPAEARKAQIIEAIRAGLALKAKPPAA
jgi:hypothetical protein